MPGQETLESAADPRRMITTNRSAKPTHINSPESTAVMNIFLDNLLARLDRVHARARQLTWLHYYTWFVRIMLALAFLPAGFTKAINERFMRYDASPDPEGIMFNALYEDFGSLYVFIGICQITAAILLLIPRTAALGAAIYLPLISGIVVLTISLHFQGTWVITSLLLLGAIYLLCWDWHRFRGIFARPQLSTSTVEMSTR